MLQLNDLLSSHFHAYEFAEHDGQLDRLPADPVKCQNIARLAAEGLEPLRKAWLQLISMDHLGGEPAIKVICGYRSPEHNRRVGGAERSLHLEGLAADICCDVNWRAIRAGRGSERDAQRMDTFASFVEKYIDHGENFGGFGVYRVVGSDAIYWLHVDLRPRVNDHVARWTGYHVGSER
jgi:hypothetical protein